MEHEIKCWPEPFQAVLDGRKVHEIRVADRPYAVGDVLELREYRPRPAPFTCKACGAVMSNRPEFVEPLHAGCGGEVTSKPLGYTGRSIHVAVTYLTPGDAWGLPANLCVMSIRRLP